jgi:hypothetical protein
VSRLHSSCLDGRRGRAVGRGGQGGRMMVGGDLGVLFEISGSLGPWN